jgi:hypothetical protein
VSSAVFVPLSYDCSCTRRFIIQYLLTPWCRILFEKLIVTQLIKNSCFLYGTRSLITVFTEAWHWTLSWASWIQFAPSVPISLRSSLMLSSHLHLGLPSGLLPSGHYRILFSLCLFKASEFLFTYGSLRHLVGLLGWGISPAPRPLPTQDNITQTHIHAPSSIRTCDPNIRATEDSTCLRPRGYWDRPL